AALRTLLRGTVPPTLRAPPSKNGYLHDLGPWHMRCTAVGRPAARPHGHNPKPRGTPRKDEHMARIVIPNAPTTTTTNAPMLYGPNGQAPNGQAPNGQAPNGQAPRAPRAP